MTFFRHYIIAFLSFSLLIASPDILHAGWTDMVDFSGYFETDNRFIVDDYRGLKDGDGYKFQMNKNDLRLRLGIFPQETVKIVVDSRLRLYGFSNANSMSALPERAKVDPFTFFLDEAYLQVSGFLWENMDLKIGRMVKTWGTIDQFNPTDNINARDFSDPLDYSTKVPNQMVEIDMYPAEWINFQFVWVPIFKPSQLPSSATLGFAVETDKNGCFETAPTPPLSINDVKELGDLFGAIPPCDLNFLPGDVRLVKPETNIQNSQFAAKAQFSVWDLDFSFSYYYGRFSFPVAYDAVADVSYGPGNWSVSKPSQIDEDFVKEGKFNVLYLADLIYPRMQSAGFDFNYSSDAIGGIGLKGEMALIFPEEIVFGLRAYQAGTKLLEMKSLNVKSDPFVKASVELDYQATTWLYVNAMYVRGFFDEFADRFGIHNYVVSAAQFSLFDSELVIQLAGVMNVDDLSAVITPEIKWVVVPSVELKTGLLMFFGDTKMSDPMDYAAKYKFGQKAAGRNVVYFKARASW